jgi:hypothetical protein
MLPQTHTQASIGDDGIVRCYHHMEAAYRISRTVTNPDRSAIDQSFGFVKSHEYLVVHFIVVPRIKNTVKFSVGDAIRKFIVFCSARG